MKVDIYGPNGSGKSNFGIALFDIVPLLTDRFVDQNVKAPGLFLNRDIKTESALFSYEFRQSGNSIIFEYEKDCETHLSSERLSVNGEGIYDYDYRGKRFRLSNIQRLVDENLTFKYFDSNISVLRYIANNSLLPEASPIKAIMDFVSRMLWFRSVGQNAFIGLESGTTFIEDWIIGNGLVDEFASFLKDTCDINVQLAVSVAADNRKILIEKHRNGNLIFQQACSNGTAAAELFYYWMKRFDNVSLLFMDEFDAYYHFALSARIIELIKKHRNLQAIFTTHNTFLMSNRILRPDCYFMMEGGRLKSYIEKADGRELREGHNLEKIYRNGGLNG